MRIKHAIQSSQASHVLLLITDEDAMRIVLT